MFIQIYVGLSAKMTKLKSSLTDIKSLVTASVSDFNIEITRSTRGVSVVISGAIGIFELTDSQIGVLTHKARVTVLGSKLSLVVYEGRALEISGRVEDIQLKYGKI